MHHNYVKFMSNRTALLCFCQLYLIKLRVVRSGLTAETAPDYEQAAVPRQTIPSTAAVPTPDALAKAGAIPRCLWIRHTPEGLWPPCDAAVYAPEGHRLVHRFWGQSPAFDAPTIVVGRLEWG